ncbi:MAG: hypothetical protein K6T90_20960 [Leptolyngbyaceae cyanobacterium HOT.MB2.61]|jgi:membrane protein implicated in regulation of membrane protease activity|nr:hypothetical protein [Leptolyngbyaceae cyanobacterium HOT.MB2.61]
MAGFLLKVIGLSVGCAIAIKYIGPLLSIPASTTNVLIAIWFPSLLMAVIFGWRWWERREKMEDKNENSSSLKG